MLDELENWVKSHNAQNHNAVFVPTLTEQGRGVSTYCWTCQVYGPCYGDDVVLGDER